MSHNIKVPGGTTVRLKTAGKYCDQDIDVTAEGGAEDLTEVLTEQDELIEQIKIALVGKVVGGGESPTEIVLQSKTVTPTKNAQEVKADANYTALEKVTVEAIPSEYIIPSGMKEIASNGTHDVTQYASVKVNVPSKTPNIQPLEITENGTYTAPEGVDGYSPITVNVASGGETTDERDKYQRVEYITSAEEETYPYIITDFIADNSCGMEIVASFPILQDRIPMGSRENSDATRFYCVYPMSANSIYYGFNTGSSISCQLKVNTIYRCQTNFLNSRLISVYDENGIRKGGTSISATLVQQSAPVSIFGYHSASSGSVSSKREYKLYSARCSKGHEVVREYIPCYRKSDGVVGLYEKFTEQFLTSEVSSFTKGADIEW